MFVCGSSYLDSNEIMKRGVLVHVFIESAKREHGTDIERTSTIKSAARSQRAPIVRAIRTKSKIPRRYILRLRVPTKATRDSFVYRSNPVFLVMQLQKLSFMGMHLRDALSLSK